MLEDPVYSGDQIEECEQGCARLRSERPNHVWSMDFAFDRTEGGKSLKILVVIDEFTREGLALEVAPSIRSEGVLSVLEGLFAIRGMPDHVHLYVSLPSTITVAKVVNLLKSNSTGWIKENIENMEGLKASSP